MNNGLKFKKMAWMYIYSRHILNVQNVSDNFSHLTCILGNSANLHELENIPENLHIFGKVKGGPKEPSGSYFVLLHLISTVWVLFGPHYSLKVKAYHTLVSCMQL